MESKQGQNPITNMDIVTDIATSTNTTMAMAMDMGRTNLLGVDHDSLFFTDLIPSSVFFFA